MLVTEREQAALEKEEMVVVVNVARVSDCRTLSHNGPKSHTCTSLTSGTQPRKIDAPFSRVDVGDWGYLGWESGGVCCPMRLRSQDIENVALWALSFGCKHHAVPPALPSASFRTGRPAL